MKTYNLIVEKGNRYQIKLIAICCGEDCHVTICGGTRYHIGSVAIGFWENNNITVNTICVPHHRDDEVASWAANYLATELECNTSVTVGIHIDNADKNEVIHLVENTKEVCRQFVSKYKMDRRCGE